MNEELRLAERVADGDHEAEERLVRDLHRPIFLAMRHLVRSREDAEDLTQQTFILIKQNIRSFRGRSSLKTWALKIGYREYLRTKKVHRTTTLDEHPFTEVHFQYVDTAEWLLDLLEALPPKLREAFILSEVEGLGVNEVSKVMSIPSGTVKTRLFHARRILRKKIVEEENQIRNVIPTHES